MAWAASRSLTNGPGEVDRQFGFNSPEAPNTVMSRRAIFMTLGISSET